MRAARAVKEAQGEALANTPHALAYCFAEQLERLITESIGTIEDYVVRVLLPLLKAIVEELCASQPAYPAVSLSLWLLEQLGAPETAMEELSEWMSKGNFKPFPLEKVEKPLEKVEKPNAAPQEKAAEKAPHEVMAKQRQSILRSKSSPVESAAAPDDESSGADMVPRLPVGPMPKGADRPRKSILKSSSMGHSTCHSSTASSNAAVPRRPSELKFAAVAESHTPEIHWSPSESFQVVSERDEEGEQSPAKRNEDAESSMDNLSTKAHRASDHDDADSDADASDRDEPDDHSAMLQLRGRTGDGRKPMANPSIDKRRFTVTIPSMPAPMPPENEVLPLLKGIGAFEGLDQSDLRRIHGIARCRIFHTDEPVTSFGAPSDEVHVVLNGKCRISVPRLVGFAERGAVFGEESLQYAGATCPNLVEAFDGPITTMSISASALNRLNVKKKKLKKANTERKARHATRDSKALAVPTDISKDSGRPIIKDYHQTEADRDMIMLAFKNNKVLAEVLQLTEEQCKLIAESVHLISLPKDEFLMKRGDHGSALYILSEGLLEVILANSDGSNIRIRPGESFGELALLYDTPRAASIRALGDCTMWVLPRTDFMAVSKLAYSERILAYSEMIGKIPLLERMVDKENRDMIADALEEISFLKDDEVCVEGEDVGLLYILFEGECEAYRGDQHVRTLKVGDWIGEEQLEKSIAAELTVVVTSNRATALVLDGSSLHMATKAVQLMRRSISAEDPNDLATKLDTHYKEKFMDSVVGQKVSRRQSRRATNSKIRRTTSGNIRESVRKDFDLTKMEKLGLLGVGSFGTVMLMKAESGEEYALKIQNKEQILKENLKECLMNEQRVMSALDSNFIVKLHKSMQDHDYIYLLMEALLGGELFDIYVDNDLFGELDSARFYISCVTLGLQHMHLNRVVYRDLKLENCIVDIKGFLKLTDMGISKIVLGKTYTVCGTADYLAPETLKRLGHNRAVDWWACGILLFIMSEGRSPFDAPEVPQIYKNIIKGISKVKFPEWFPSELTDVIKSLCRKKPEDRVTMQKGGVRNLTSMEFFKPMDFEKLAVHDFVPPHIPDSSRGQKFKPRLSQGASTLEAKDFANLDDWDGRVESLNGKLEAAPGSIELSYSMHMKRSSTQSQAETCDLNAPTPPESPGASPRHGGSISELDLEKSLPSTDAP